MLKNKRILLIVGAVAFIVLLFFLKTNSQFKNEAKEEAGLTYGDVTVKDLLYRDTDLDGVLDWEEGLWGTDPMSKDTDGDGIPDSTEVAQMRPGIEPASTDGFGEAEEENLTQTDKFARELFSTVATLNQTGEVDQNTIDTLSTSLVEQIQNYPTKKIYTLSDINITLDNSVQSVQKYDKATDVIFLKYPTQSSIVSVLEESVMEDGEINSAVLLKLDPITQQLKVILNKMAEVEVPQDLSSLHLNLMNALERIMENLSDIQLVEDDAIIALGAMSQYEDNSTKLDSAFLKIVDAIKKKLGN